MPTPSITQAKELLQEYYGYDSFHPGQEQIMARILAGQDALGIMPTGAGKSVCYQIPAMLLPGLTIVISPLISLMKDQVDALCRIGIPAALFNSSLSQMEMNRALLAMKKGALKLIYIAPERLEAEEFVSMLCSLEVSMVAVDEAHCVSQWGHDFRPSYRRIRDLIAAFPRRPIVSAFTATATQEVRRDMLTLLAMQQPFELVTGFDRENLYFAVYSPADRDGFVLDYLRANRGSCGIIYCLTRKQVDALADLLTRSGFAALPYHAGLEDEQRRQNQDAFRDDTVEIIVATNAFGMGIDKSNVRFVLHYGMPKTLENYYQEAGRAGRDGVKSDCILLYNAQDIVTNRFLIEHSNEDSSLIVDKSGEYRRLQEMIDYCNIDSCLRRYILRYFGERDLPENCDNCLNCNSSAEKTEITVEAQKIISCVKRMGNRFGSQLVAQVLRGSDTQKIRELGFKQLSTYGIMREYSEKSLRELISYLVAQGLLEVSGGEYPVLAAGERAMKFLREKERLFIKRRVTTEASSRSEIPSKSKTPTAHEALFQKLRELRRSLAQAQNIPPYVIFSDATLVAMTAALPTNAAEMRQVSGVGQFKLEQYGDEFIRVIREYMDEHGIQPPMRNIPAVRQKAQDKPRENGASALQSYALYAEGKTVAQIAAERGITGYTVEQHLVAALQAGHAVNPDDFIPEEHRKAIFAAIETHGTERLKPLKDALPSEVSYTAIRFAVAKAVIHRTLS